MPHPRSRPHTRSTDHTHDDQTIVLLPVDPPLLSDISFVVVDCDHAPPSVTTTSFHNWRARDVDAFAADFQSAESFAAPITDVQSAIDSYNTTLDSLFDKYVRAELKLVKTTSSSARWSMGGAPIGAGGHDPPLLEAKGTRGNNLGIIHISHI